METLKSLLNQTLLVWKDSTAAGRLGIMLLAVLLIGSIVGIGIWSAQPHYITLVEDLTSTEVKLVIDALAKEGIDYQPQGSGSIIAVDKRDWAKAQVVVRGLNVGTVTSDTIEPGLFVDPTTRDQMINRNREQALAKQIERQSLVSQCRVFLNIPQPSAFVRRSPQPSASVDLTVKPGFGNQQAAAIAMLVARSVADLKPENISITDSEGRIYATDTSMMHTSTQLDYQRNQELHLTQQVQTQLDQMFGVGNANVTVSTQWEFVDKQVDRLVIDRDDKSVIEMTETTTTGTPLATTGMGTAGSATNLTPSESASSASAGRSVTEMMKSTYKYPEEREISRIRQPKLTSITAGVMVNKALVEDGNGQVPGEKLKSVENLVRKTLGIPVEETDGIAVEFVTFHEFEEDEEVAGAVIPWDQINEILKNVSLGVAALVALFIGFRAIKKFQPETPSGAEVSQSNSSIGKLSEMVKENPEIFNQIIASWSSAAQPAGENDEVARAA